MAMLLSSLFVASASKPELRVNKVLELSRCPGLRAKRGDTVHVNHEGFFDEDSGRRQIDSNCPPSQEVCEPLAFEIGAHRIIKGMERGVVGMCEGETYEVFIPPHLAYDNANMAMDPEKRPVPAGSWVMYRIEMVRIERPGIEGSAGRIADSLEAWQLGVGCAIGALLVALSWRSTQRRAKNKPKRKTKKG